MSSHKYKIYFDEFMTRLLNENLSCTIGDYAYCAIFYADDIVTKYIKKKMQRMIGICYEYGLQYGIIFDKSFLTHI